MAIEYHCDVPQETTETIRNEAQFAQLARDAEPGASIKIIGNYDNDVVWRANGTNDKPIHLDFSAAKMKNMVFIVEGDQIRVKGGDWRNAQVTIEGNFNRVSRCWIHDGKTGGNSSKFNSAILVTRSARSCRVDHNLVERWIGKAIRHAKFTEEGKDNLIDYNHLRNMSDGRDGNGREVLQIGAGRSEMKLGKMNTHIIYNLVEDCDLETEILSIKSNGNTIKYNTFLNCPISAIVCRTGSSNLIAGNYMLNTRGIIIQGDNNEVNGNEITGNNSRSEVGIRSGDCTVAQLKAGKFPGGHPAAQNTTVVFNKCSIGEEFQIGEMSTGKNEYYDEQWFPAFTTQLFENKGDIRTEGKKFRELETTVLNSFNGPRYHTERLIRSDVGLDAPDIYCTDDNTDDYNALREAYNVSAVTLQKHVDAHTQLGVLIGKLPED